MGFVTPTTTTISPNLTLNGELATKIAPPGYMGFFGKGLWRVFYASDTWVCPSDVTVARIRVLGGGGSSGLGSARTGGAGGGYDHGVFNVTPGNSYAITVGLGGAFGTPTAGGSSSFASLITATGGEAGKTGSVAAIGGIGMGGDFRAKGGNSGAANGSGGGGAASQLGDGGASGAVTGSGGGAVAGNGSTAQSGSGGASAFGNGTLSFPGPNVSGIRAAGVTGDTNPFSMPLRFPFDGFVGAGGYNSGAAYNAGSGAGGGGGTTGTNGGPGGGGGGGSTGTGGSAGFGGGGGGGGSGAGSSGNGGDGLVIIEY